MSTRIRRVSDRMSMLSRIALAIAALACGCSAAVDSAAPPADKPSDVAVCVEDADCPRVIGCAVARCAPDSPKARQNGCEYTPTPGAACTRYAGGVPVGSGVCVDADGDGDLQCHDVSPV